MLTADSMIIVSSQQPVPVDSLLQTVDSTVLEISAFSGFEGLPIQSLLMSESWLAALFLVLFFLLSFSVWLNPALFFDNLKSLGGLKKQYFGSLVLQLSTAPIFLFSYLLLSAGIISLYAYFFLSAGRAQVDIFAYLYFFVITMLYLFLKIYFIRLLCYVFFDKKTFSLLIKTFYNRLLLLNYGFFPLLVLAFYSSFLSLHIFVVVGAVFVFLLALISSAKLFQLFLGEKLASFYILLYLCTLEIMPVLVLFQVYKLIA